MSSGCRAGLSVGVVFGVVWRLLLLSVSGYPMGFIMHILITHPHGAGTLI